MGSRQAEEGVRLIAHRGFAGVAPENTLGAFRAVADGTHPADMIEFDVMPAADGTPVVIHDTQLAGRSDRPGPPLTDATGMVWETDLATVTDARVLGTAQTIPTLRSVVDAMPSEVGLNVELRNPGSADVHFGRSLSTANRTDQRRRWQPFVDAVLADVRRGEHELLLSSFFDAALAAVRERDPDVPLAVNVHDSIEAGIAIAERHTCEAIHPRLNMIRGSPYFEGPHGSLTDPDFSDIDVVAVARERGVSVHVWTVQTAVEAAHLVEAGVDGLILDYPGLLAGWNRAVQS